MQRSFGERIAMNSPIQGTASDIMKIAMIRVSEALKKEGLEAKMLLQIHDEILIEAPINEKDKVQELLIREMKNAAKLKVSLEVSSGVADNWYDLK
jgi:DNA polymerase-1